jgi:hypothetical protein
VIQITNVDEIVRRERGFWVAKLGPYVTDLEAAVEASVIEEIEQSFAERGIEATIVSMRKARLNMLKSAAENGN